MKKIHNLWQQFLFSVTLIVLAAAFCLSNSLAYAADSSQNTSLKASSANTSPKEKIPPATKVEKPDSPPKLEASEQEKTKGTPPKGSSDEKLLSGAPKKQDKKAPLPRGARHMQLEDYRKVLKGPLPPTQYSSDPSRYQRGTDAPSSLQRQNGYIQESQRLRTTPERALTDTRRMHEDSLRPINERMASPRYFEDRRQMMRMDSLKRR